MEEPKEKMKPPPPLVNTRESFLPEFEELSEDDVTCGLQVGCGAHSSKR